MHATAHVLTVEDDPIVRADLRLVLEDAGFSVCPDARDGVEAVELAREHEPDVILLDLGLPRVDGVEVTRRILAERSVPIVALTGHSRDVAERAVEAGVTSYVLKPCGDGEIVQALHDAIATHATTVLSAAREESRLALIELAALFGYPEEWGAELEERAFAAGKAWKRTR
jgi:two-component system, response regulator PdtaR